MPLNMGSAVAYLELDTSKFSTGFKNAIADLKTFTDKYNDMSTRITGLQSAFDTLGGGLTKGLTLPIIGIGTAAVKMTSDFDKQMSEVQAISQSTSSEFDALRDKAIELGGSTSFSASEVAAAMTEMAKAGWDSTDIISGMEGVLDAAAASGENLASVGTIVADAITGFGLSAKDSIRVADLLTQAANSGTIGVTDLAESYKYISPIAKTMGFSIEDTTTAITALSTAGIKGSQAGTTLRTMLSQLNNPTAEVADAMEKLGIDIADNEGNFYSLNDILEQMRGTFSKLTPEQQAYYANILAGREGMSGLMAILGMTQEEYDAISDSMENASGVADETAAVMQDNLAGAMEQLSGAFESAAIVIGERLTPYIRSLADFITGLVDKFNSLSESQQDLVVKVGLFLAAIGPLLLIFSKIISIGTTLSGIFGTIGIAVGEAAALVNAGFTGMATQAGLIGKAVALVLDPINALKNIFTTIIGAINPVVVVIGVLVGAFTTLWKTNENFRNQIGTIWNTIKSNVSVQIDEIKDKLSEFGISFETIVQTIKDIWMAFVNIIAPVFTNGLEIIGNVITGFLGVVSGFITTVGSLLTGNFDAVFQGLTQIFTSIVTMITNIGANILQIIGGIASNLLSTLGFDKAAEIVQNFFNTLANFVFTLPQTISNLIQSFSQLPTKIKQFLDKVINNVKTWATNLANNAKTATNNFVNNVSNSVKSLPNKFKNAIDKVINSVKTWASNLVSNAKSAATNFINGVITTITKLPSNVSKILSNVINAISKWATQMLQKGIQGAKSLINGVKQGASNIVSQVMSIGKNIVDGVWQGIQNAASSFLSNIKNFFSNLVNTAKNAVGIHSPSKVFDEEIGQNIVKGLIQGVNKQKKNADKNAKELSQLYVDAAEEKLKQLKKKNDISLTVEIEFWKQIKKETKKGTKGYKEAQKEIKKLRKELNSELKALQTDYQNNVSEINKQLIQDINEVTNAYDEAVKSRQEEIVSSLGLFSAFKDETENTTESLINNLQSQVNAIKEWSNILNSLEKRGIGQGLLEELQEMGVSSLADIRLLNSMTDTELNKYVALWNEKNSAALNQALNEIDKQTYINEIKGLINEAGKNLDNLEAEYLKSLKALGVETQDTSVEIGTNIVKGIESGINSAFPEMRKELKQMCKKITKTVKNALKISSPSKVFAELGQYTAQGFGVGFGDEFTKVNSDVKSDIEGLSNIDTTNIFDIMLQKYRTMLQTLQNTFSNTFIAFSDGLENSLNSMISKLEIINEKMYEITDIWQSIKDSEVRYLTDKNNIIRKQNEGNTNINTSGGDTFNFYDVEKNPYEYAREMKRAKRELQYGY